MNILISNKIFSLKHWLWYILTKTARFWPNRLYINLQYMFRFGHPINWAKPITFNEKLQWLKLHRLSSIYTDMVDKSKAKDIVRNLLPNSNIYIIPTISIHDKFDDINFDKLPNQFVIKCTHDSGGVVICKDKSSFDIEKAKTEISRRIKKNYYYQLREYPYKDVKPRILVEQYMEDEFGELRDYKLFCFNGKVKCLKIDFDRFGDHHANYYDINGVLLDYGEIKCPPKFDAKITSPPELQDMIIYAEVLAKNIPFVRIDFYCISGKLYFGEFTFFPASGFGKFTDDEFDMLLGSWLDLNH